MPRIDDLLEQIGQARYIKSFDLCKGYWQVAKLQTTYRLQDYINLLFYTFGLHGVPATFQPLMDQVLQGCDEWAAAYLKVGGLFTKSKQVCFCGAVSWKTYFV